MLLLGFEANKKLNKFFEIHIPYAAHWTLLRSWSQGPLIAVPLILLIFPSVGISVTQTCFSTVVHLAASYA